MAVDFSEIGVNIGITSDSTAPIDQVVNKLAKFGKSTTFTKSLNKEFNQLTKGSRKFTEQQLKQRKQLAALNVWSNRLGVTSAKLRKNMGDQGLTFTQTGKFMRIGATRAMAQTQALRSLTSSGKKLNQVQKESNIFQGKAWQKAHMGRIVETAGKWNMSVRDLSSGLQSQNMYINKQNKLVSFATKKVLNQRSAQARLTMATSRFKMELLSVMFFGMALVRMFSSLTRTSFEWAGVTGIMSAALGILFLPIALKVSEWAMKFLEGIGKLTDTQKMWIGSIMLVVGVLGGLLMVFGQMSLGMSGLLKLFPAWGAAVKAAGGLLVWFKLQFIALAPWFLIVGGAALLVWGLVKAWKAFRDPTAKAVDKVQAIAIALTGLGLLLVGLAIKFHIVWLAALGPIGWIILAVTALVAVFATLWKKFEGFRNFWKSMGSVITGKGWNVETPTPTLVAAQKGGIFTRPTPVLIGEKGPEAVIPLNRLGAGGGQTIDFHPTINIKASITNDLDINRLARRLNEMLYSDLRRLGVR